MGGPASSYNCYYSRATGWGGNFTLNTFFSPSSLIWFRKFRLFHVIFVLFLNLDWFSSDYILQSRKTQERSSIWILQSFRVFSEREKYINSLLSQLHCETHWKCKYNQTKAKSFVWHAFQKILDATKIWTHDLQIRLILVFLVCLQFTLVDFSWCFHLSITTTFEHSPKGGLCTQVWLHSLFLKYLTIRFTLLPFICVTVKNQPLISIIN